MRVQRKGGGHQYTCIDQSESNYFCTDGERCVLLPKATYEPVSVETWRDVTGECEAKHYVNTACLGITHGDMDITDPNSGRDEDRMKYRLRMVNRDTGWTFIVEKKETL